MIDKEKFEIALHTVLRDLYGDAAKKPPLDVNIVLTMGTVKRAIEKYDTQ